MPFFDVFDFLTEDGEIFITQLIDFEKSFLFPKTCDMKKFGFLFFDNEGRLKVSELEKEESLAFDMLSFFSSEQHDKRIIDARHKFAKKRYFDKYRWEPSDEIVAGIAEAIFGKLI